MYLVCCRRWTQVGVVVEREIIVEVEQGVARLQSVIFVQSEGVVVAAQLAEALRTDPLEMQPQHQQL